MGALVCVHPSVAFGADERLKTAVLSPVTVDPSIGGFAGAVERVLRADLERLKVANIEGTPALKLNDLQLAVGCVGETPGCLEQVAKQLEVEALVLIHIDRTGDETVMTGSIFDRRTKQSAQQALRKASGPRAENELLDQIDPMLRELYRLPPAVKEDNTKLKVEHPPVVEEHPRSVVPFVVMGVGVAVLAAGGIVGLIANGTKNDYKNTRVATMADANRAIDLRTRASNQATAANVLFVVGGAGIAAGAVLLVVPFGGD